MKFLIGLMLASASVFSQDYPQGYFRAPLDIPLQLAGNFGELRNNHFHAGFDLRTQQKEGFNVYAAADGYVSRIKISTYGYGKAIYITHPNGYTTLYGHLRAGAGPVQKWIKDYQYKNQVYEFDAFLKPDELPVKKGEIIAFSGNTGGSEGPHLHFEFRDAKTEAIINPYFFGFSDQLPDTKRPVITSVLAYPVSDDAVVNQSAVPIVLDVKKMQDGSYMAEKVSVKGKIGFGFSGTDADDNSGNPNGIFRVAGLLNGNEKFSYTFDTFKFDETRFVNALIDYQRYKSTKQRVQQLFMRNRYDFPLMHPDEDNGLVTLQPGTDAVYRIEATDFSGNKSVVTIPLSYSDAPALNSRPVDRTPYFLEMGKDHNYRQGDYEVFFPANTFYRDFYLNFDVKDGKLILDNKDIAVNDYFTITLKDASVPESDIDKTFIATFAGGRAQYNETTYKNGVFRTRVRALGVFGLAKDTLAPKITVPKSEQGKWLSRHDTLVAYIRDDLSGIRKYDGYINGKWALFEYNYKNGQLKHNFADGIYENGRNELKIVVSDNAGNSAIFETTFFKSKP
jgi:murein DD-endopeptidase MepM/ murein hydrolase activator NlpD